MPLPSDVASALTKAGIRFTEDAPLSRRAWWRAGGLADAWVSVRTVAQLQHVLRIAHGSGQPVFPMGNGSNLLVSDRGIRGIVVQLSGDLARCGQPEAGVVQLGAGLKLMMVHNKATRNDWTGLECFAGIPGTVGGAVRMNAGSRLGEVVDQLAWVEVVHPSGELERLAAADLGLGYRTSALPTGAVVTKAAMRLTDEDPVVHQARVRGFLERRKSTQPLDLPSCGSTFRNPDGDHAGRLIEAAGLKGFQIGGAQISRKHANFIVNIGEASAMDIRTVIATVQQRVGEAFGVRLHPEVHFVGDWSGWTGLA